ncbi:putrescine transporter PotE [Photobacterium damselae subsp. piscicida]|nr:putrescine transporter PotE [Photobacterium damselae subsp. piscicida]
MIGWFGFDPKLFAEAWNPHDVTTMTAIESGISLTLWAFLGIESAGANSGTVENPKRNVPLACMLATLFSAITYIASTTVIQGIVPNAELAKSDAPFGLVFAMMFDSTVGNIITLMVVTPIDLLMVKFTFYKRSNNLIVHLFAFRKTNGFSY